MRYVALLRGINVGGKRKILMSDLKTMLIQLGYFDIKTYMQSGNVFFTSKKTSKEVLQTQISEGIESKFGFKVPVLVITEIQFCKLPELNPYQKEDVSRLHITILSELPEKGLLEKLALQEFSPDQFSVKGNYIFLNIEGKYHKSKLTNAFFEKQLKVNATTRNWKTITKLINMVYNK